MKPKVEVFHLIFLKWDNSFVIPNKQTKLFVANLGTLLEGTVSQIFNLRLSFHVMTKKGTFFAFFYKFIF